MVIVPDEGEVWLLDLLMRSVVANTDPWHMHLYSNNYAPVASTTVSSFTEATFSGYAIAELDRSIWTVPDSVNGVALSIYGAGLVSWSATSGTQDIYGYYVTDWSDSVCLWAERFPGVVQVSTIIPVLVTPLMRLRSEFN